MGYFYSKKEIEIDYFDKEIEQLNIYVCGNQKELINFNKQLEVPTIRKETDIFFQNKHPLYNWFFNFYNQQLTKEILNNPIMSDIINDQKKIFHNSNNILLIFLDEIKNIENNQNIIEYTLKILEPISKIYKPIILYAIKKEIEEERNSEYRTNLYLLDNIKNKNNLDENFLNKYIEFCYYQENDFSEINKKLSSLCCYYNNISDIFSILDEMIKGGKSFHPNEENLTKYASTFNIIVMGRPGGGKSTLINLLLNKRKAKEGIGLSITRNVSKYIHDKYPITFQDTPGFENNIDLKKMKLFLNDYYNYFKDGKNKIHLVLYVINASNERTFIDEEVNLINDINKMKIPIFFVCTRAKNKEYAKNFKEVTKLNFLQNFGENSTLIEHIYCCHLFNEKDGIYKRFGIDILLQAIQEYFLKEINSSKFLGDFKNIQDFEQYLNSLSDNIIEKYAFLTYKNEERKKKNNKALMRLVGDKINELMVDHLALELNGNYSGQLFLKEFKKSIIKELEEENFVDESNEICPFSYIFKKNNIILNNTTINIDDKEILREINITKEIGNSAKNFFLKKLNIFKYENYLSEILNDYKKAINSITNLLNVN